MARCKLTNMNLRNIRKSREYQCLLIDLVKTGVVGKSAAEGLLGYTIPTGLLGDTTPTTPSDNEEEETDNTVTLLYLNLGGTPGDGEWLTAKYDLTNDPTGDGIIDFAKDIFSDDNINAQRVSEEDSTYEEGKNVLHDKYMSVDPQPETIEPGMLVEVYYDDRQPAASDTEE